jgi:hypothetical protein
MRIGPSVYVVTPERIKKTRAIQVAGGLMAGRTSSTKGVGDRTRIIRAKRDINVDGKPGIGRQDIHDGQVLGRLKQGEKSPSSIEITPYFRRGKFVDRHIRKIHRN